MLQHRINLWLVGALLSGGLLPGSTQADDSFVPIFDGKSLAGWDGDPQHWRVEDGAITGEATKAQAMKANTFIIWRQGEVDDFELKAEFRLAGGNSGIQYRSFGVPEAGRWVVGGYQADMDADDQWTGGLYGERYRGVLAAPGQKTVIGKDHKPKAGDNVADRAVLQSLIHKGEWNEYHIVARGNHFTQAINGRIVTDVTDDDPDVRRRGGLVALQLHAGFDMKVQFRNILLKRLPMTDGRKVVMVAGSASHGHMEHEHYAGCRLLADDLNANAPGIYATVYRNGWPQDPTAFDNANAIVMYCDGGEGHMVMGHLREVDKLAKRGVGIACLHYGVEVPKGEAGDDFLSWIGGYFETDWSVNPHWTADFKTLPTHAITSGVKPFSIQDEWYYHMRFRKDMAGVTPILTAIPPAETLRRPDGPHEGNPAVRAEAGQPQHLAWAVERKDGGRGFGFTGGHFHYNWGHDQFRKLVLNAIVWTAKGEVPKDGVKSTTPTVDDLEKNQDEPRPKRFDPDKIRKDLERWNQPPAARS